MEHQFIRAEELHKFLADLEKEFHVYAPFQKGDTQYYREFSRESERIYASSTGSMTSMFESEEPVQQNPLKHFSFMPENRSQRTTMTDYLWMRKKLFAL